MALDIDYRLFIVVVLNRFKRGVLIRFIFCTRENIVVNTL